MDIIFVFGTKGRGSNPLEGTMNKFSIFNFQFSILFLAVFLGILFFPLFSSAQGLVPCGEPGNPCQFCHLFVLVENIINFFLINIVFPVATLIIIIGGLMFLLYTENAQRVEQAKSLLTAAIIGLVLIFSSWIIVNFFLTAIGLSDFTVKSIWPDQWFEINCP